MRRTKFLQIALFLSLLQVFCCKDEPISQPHSGTRPLFESTATPVVCSNAGDPTDLISSFQASRADSTSLSYIFTNQSLGAVSYVLEFGDGTPPFRTEAFTTKTHTFAGPGMHVVTLFVMRGEAKKCSEQRIIL